MGDRIVARTLLNTATVDQQGSALEAFAGRLLAACVHPWLTWRVSSPAGRTLIVFTYAAAAFLAMYGALLIWAPVLSR